MSEQYSQSVSMETRQENGKTIAVAWVNNPPVNVLSHHVRLGLSKAIAAAQDTADAVVIAGTNDTFIAGADIREFGQPLAHPILFELCDEIEASTIPVVIAIEGNTLGGGLETALSGHYRVANPKAKLGFPEVNLGLIPGAGGTQRTPRLLNNIVEAMGMASSGKPISGVRAGEIGLVDHVADDTVNAAVTFATGVTDEPLDSRRLSKVTLTLSTEDKAAADVAMAEVKRKARGAIAPEKAAEAVRLSYELSFDEGIAHERKTFMELVVGDQSKALRHVFFAERQAAKPIKPLNAEPRKVEKVGILGAGTMGGGIAMTYVEAGFPVVMLEQSEAALDRGLGVMEKNWARGIRSGRITEAGVAANMAKITRTTSYDDLADCDLIVEAVFETMDVKRDVFAKLDKAVKPGAVIATNTSYLDVNAIAAVTSRPQDVIGMHYFSPANVMKLLEIVDAKETAPDVLATALAMAKKTRKQPVIAKVGHGFIGNRMLTPYFRQANLLVLEGAEPAQVDAALMKFGWAMGPISVSDLAGLDIGSKSRADQDLEQHERDVYRAADALVAGGHLGQKSGSGFYVYDPETRAKSENPAAVEAIANARKELGITPRAISEEEIVERTMYALANEGAHVLSEGIAARASDIDVAYIHGYGYARWRGGPMHYADSIGLQTIADKLLEWSQGPSGMHWTPSDLLLELADNGSSFAQFDKDAAKS